MKENYLVYVVLNTGARKLVSRVDCDATEQAGIIDRTLLPVLASGKGWANNRRSSFRVTGEINSNSATLQLLDVETPVATLAVCLKAKASIGLWNNVACAGANAGQAYGKAPPPAWAALRYDVPDDHLPTWIHWWAQHVAFALLTREGW